MTIGDMFELLDGQEYLGRDILNTYYYLQLSGGGGVAESLAAAWKTYVLPELLDNQAVALTHVALAVRNLGDPTDFWAEILSANNVGELTGEELPAYVAWYFRYNRTRTDMNHGRKAICGVTNSAVANGEATAAMITSLNELAGSLEGVITGSGGETFKPVIKRTNKDLEGNIIGYSPMNISGVDYVRLSTQNTRKS